MMNKAICSFFLLHFSAFAGTISIYNNSFQYAGAYFDTESALQYLNTRYYNPAIMRFSARDTDDLINRYGYVFDANPIMDEDPSGHSSTDIQAIIDKTLAAAKEADEAIDPEVIKKLGYQLKAAKEAENAALAASVATSEVAANVMPIASIIIPNTPENTAVSAAISPYYDDQYSKDIAANEKWLKKTITAYGDKFNQAKYNEAARNFSAMTPEELDQYLNKNFSRTQTVRKAAQPEESKTQPKPSTPRAKTPTSSPRSSPQNSPRTGQSRARQQPGFSSRVYTGTQ